MKKLGLDKRTVQLNEHLNPELQLDEGLESGINRIINWVNKNVMKKFWTVDQKSAERKLTDKKVAALYNELAIDNPDIMKLISSNVNQYAIEKAMAKAGYSADDIEPDGSGDNSYNVAARMHTVIQMLKGHHREEKKKGNSRRPRNAGYTDKKGQFHPDEEKFSGRRTKKKVSPK